MRCEFDNTAANQPYVNGALREPEDVAWGDGSYDEMCSAGFYITGIAEKSEACPNSLPADEGRFEVTFDAAENVRTSDKLDGELMGTVYLSVFNAEDVDLLGPKGDAQPVAVVPFEGIDLRDGPDGPHLVDVLLPAGDYEFLGFMDTDANSTGEPDLNDPLMIPGSPQTLECGVQSVTARFSFLLPDL